MRYDERCFSNTVLIFFSLSSVFLTMVMSMSLSEYGPSVNITFIVVWKQVGRRTWRRMALCSSCHSFKQMWGSENCRQKHGLNWFQFVLSAVIAHFTFFPLCAYELMLDQSSYPQTLNHILPQQKTKVALDQLERVRQRACRFLLLFSPLPGLQPVLSHPPLIALCWASGSDGFMDAKGKKYAPHG